MENQEYLDKYEAAVGQTVREFLMNKQEIDTVMPDAPDIEGKWEAICQSYLPDGAREFNDYPTVSLGWMMFVGMAVAKLWDEDWEKHFKAADLYLQLRDVRGFDCMDEHICEDILRLNAADAQTLTQLIGRVSQMAHHALLHEGFEPSTPLAFHAYIRTLHQLYILGAAVQLKRMGYRMTKICEQRLHLGVDSLVGRSFVDVEHR